MQPAPVVPLWQCEDDARGCLRGARRALQRRELAAGQPLFRQGDSLCRVFVLMSGAVQVSRLDRQGRARIVDLVLPGDVLGFDDFASGVYSGSAQALRDALVCAIEPARWQSLRQRDLRLPALASLGASQVQRAMRQNMRLRLGSAARLADWLLQLAARVESPNIELPLSYQDLAEYLDLRPETLSRALRELERRQCLRRAGGLRLELDPELLRQTRATPRPRQV